MDGIEKIGLQIGSQLVKGGAIQQGTGMAVVLVLFDEHMTCDSDLPFQLDPDCRRVHEPPRPRRGPARHRVDVRAPLKRATRAQYEPGHTKEGE